MEYYVKFVFLLLISFVFAAPLHAKILVLTDEPYFKEALESCPNLIKYDSDSLSNDGSYQIFSRKFYNSKIPGWEFPIVQRPINDNEFRYILFAWKQKGGQSLMIQLANRGKWGSALSYTAGIPGNTLLKINLSPRSPENWNVVVRDVYKDMLRAQFDQNFNHHLSLKSLVITGIALIPWDGEYAQFDKIILGTDKEELDQIAEGYKKNMSQGYKDPISTKKEQLDDAVYYQYDWKNAADDLLQIESNLTADEKSFFSRDAALANAWLFLDNSTKGSEDKALEYYNKSQEYISILGLPEDAWGLPYLKTLFAERKAMGKIEPSCTMKIALLVVPQIKTEEFEDSFDPAEYKKFALEWEIVKSFIERETQGKLSIETEMFVVDGYYNNIVYDGGKKRVDISKIEPYPADLLTKLARDFDVIVFYYPTLTASTAVLGKFIIGSGHDLPKRGTLKFNRGHSNPDDFILPLHEFSHLFEFFFKLKTTHIFRNDPDFFKRPLPIELSYYEDLYKNVIPEKIKSKYGSNWNVLSWHEQYPLK